MSICLPDKYSIKGLQMKVLQVCSNFLRLDEEIEGHKANRAAFIKQKLEKVWRGLPGYADLDAFLEKLAEVDPTQKGIYMPWMATLVMKAPQQNRPEDLDRVGSDLQEFEKYKARLQNKDINQYKSFSDLYKVIKPLQDQPVVDPEAEKKAAELAAVKQDILVVYTGPEGWIRIPTTEKAACFLGQNTRWCTAADKNNMFHSYNKSDNLFVIYDKSTKQRYQLHIGSDQFAQEDDEDLGIESVPEWARKPIVDYYIKNNPRLSFRQILILQYLSDQNIAAGTPVEGFMALCKKYNVEEEI
jgi:hypothetical protein